MNENNLVEEANIALGEENKAWAVAQEMIKAARLAPEQEQEAAWHLANAAIDLAKIATLAANHAVSTASERTPKP
jgi:hypothetical protein